MHADFQPFHAAFSDYEILLLPGYGNSGPEHWLTHWEHNFANAHRVVQDDWDRPDLIHWSVRLQSYVSQSHLSLGKPILLVGHSMGCLLASHWLNEHDQETDFPVVGALLVAPPNINRPDFPEDATRFDQNQYKTLNVPSTVIASSNDPYCQLSAAQHLADGWGSNLVEVGEQGHINTDSKLGNWTAGLQALVELAKQKTD